MAVEGEVLNVERVTGERVESPVCDKGATVEDYFAEQLTVGSGQDTAQNFIRHDIANGVWTKCIPGDVELIPEGVMGA